MPSGLSVNSVVNVAINLAPTATAVRNFGAFLVLGATDVVDVGERIRPYTAMDGVALDFSATDPEYLAAQLYFSQVPRPSMLYIGRWAKTATAGLLKGGVLSAAQQLLSNFTVVTNGALSITTDGTARNLTAVNLSTATSLAQVASLITAAGTLGGTITWDPVRGRFRLKSATTGATSTVGFATVPGAGTNLGPLLGFTAANGAVTVSGMALETPAAAVSILAAAEADWYGTMFADTSLTDPQHLQIAALIEALDYSRIYGITTQASTALDATVTSDLPSQLKTAGYSRTLVQYSSANPYAVASIFGRISTVDFTASRSTITLKFKVEPGVAAETITAAQAAALRGKNVNVFVNYQNSAAIIQEGVMSSGTYIDERHGLDWAQNSIQNRVWNVLYSGPKVPQTEAGVTQIVNAVAAACADAVTNGLVAPGTWNGPAFGALSTGDALNTGYYIYSPTIASQAQSDRDQRRAPTIQVALKLAGAVHFANVLVAVNR